MTLRNGIEAPLADWPDRFLARFIDFALTVAFLLAATLLAVLAIVVGLLAGANWNWGDENTEAAVSGLAAFLILVAAVAVALLYEPVTTARSGQTLGKRSHQIKVVSYDDGLVPIATVCLMRWIVPIAAGALGWVCAAVANLPMPYLGMPLLWLLVHTSARWDKGRRGWHDMMAGTAVVEASWLPPPPRPPASMRRREEGGSETTQTSWGLVSDYDSSQPRRPQ